MTSRRALALALIAFALAPQSSRAVGRLRLDVARADGHVVWSVPVERGDRFDIVFTHSSEQCRWTHHYRVVGMGDLDQLGSAFPCFGAGMPAQSAAGRGFGRSKDGYEAVIPMRLDAVRMMNWRPADLTLRVKGREWPVGWAIDDYAAFTVAVR